MPESLYTFSKVICAWAKKLSKHIDMVNKNFVFYEFKLRTYKYMFYFLYNQYV